MDTITGKVTRVETVGASMYGNPTKRVAIEDEHGDTRTYLTSANAMIAYAIGNAEFRDEPHTFLLTKAGRINGYER